MADTDASEGSAEAGLGRFLDAQEGVYPGALRELREGRKRTHWIWFVFPQIKGLGRSAMAHRYGIAGLAEARAYLAHPLLGERLREATRAMLTHRDPGADAILGGLDALKFQSSMTLFSLADPDEPLFAAALARFFGDTPDPRTIELLRPHGEV